MANQSQSEQYAFNAFANLPFYSSINSEFVELANIYDKKSIVDLGCGTGNITKLILEKIISAKDFLNGHADFINNKLTEERIKALTPLDLMMFNQTKELTSRIGDIYMLEGSMYSNELEMAGRVDCIAEFAGKVSVIDFKTSTKPKSPSKIKGYFMQETAYAKMFEERYGRAIDQIAVLIVCEDGALQTFVKDKKDYLPLLQPAIDEFWAEQDAVQPNSH